MFTGLIEATGTIAQIAADAGGRRLRVATSLGAELTDGDSIAVNGVCLTVIAADSGSFSAILSPETLRVTTFGSTAEGQLVNLERPLRPDARMGGHFVLGHVDGTGAIAGLAPQGDCHWLDVDVPAALLPLMVPKGSIAIDGISLTIAALAGARVGVQIVPFTLEHTALRAARVGQPVNIEADVIGKYVARLIDARDAARVTGSVA